MSRQWALVSAVVIGVAILAVGAATSEEDAGGIEVADPLSYVRIYSDADGESHFADGELAFTLVDFAPPAPPVSVSEVMAAESVAVISSPAGWHGDWHPAPRRQLMLLLAGELEVKVSDGEVRRFGPGAVLLVEDTVGKGHVSTVVGDKRGFMANVPLSDMEAQNAAHDLPEQRQFQPATGHETSTAAQELAAPGIPQQKQNEKQIVALFDVWNTRNLEDIDTIFTPDGVYEDVTDQSASRGRGEIRDFLRECFTWAPDTKVELTSVFVSGDRGTSTWVWSGTQTGEIPGLIAATGREFSIIGASVYEFEDGMISKNSDYYDGARFLAQLGVAFTFPGDDASDK